MTSKRWVAVAVIVLAVGGALAWSYYHSSDEVEVPSEQSTPAIPSAAETTPALSDESPAATALTETAPAVASPTDASETTARSAHSGSGRIVGRIILPPNAPRGLEVSVALHRVPSELEGLTGTDSLQKATEAATDGVYHFGHLSAGTYEVLATAPGYAGVDTVELSPQRAEESALDLRLFAVGTVSGRVLNADGVPVEGAAVVIVESETYGNRSFDARMVSHSSEHVTAADGVFSITTAPASASEQDRYRLMAMAEGYAPSVTDHIRAGTPNVDIVLKPGSTVSGILVDADTGAPIPGKHVALESAAPMMGPPANTDAEGFFFLADVPPGPQRARLIDDELVITPESAGFTVAEAAPVDEVMLRATKGGRITGRVYDNNTGTGVAGVRVRASVFRDSQDRAHEGVSGANGVYAIGGLSSDTYRVSYDQPEGYPSAPTSFLWNKQVVAKIGGEITGVDFPLNRGVLIRGRVEDESGTPIAGANVHAYSTRGGTSDFTDSKPDGTFVLAGFAPGDDVSFSAGRSGYATVRTEPKNSEVTLTDKDADGVRIVLGPASSIAGTVVDAQGKPKAGMEMTASPVDDALDSSWAVSAADGSILFEDLSAGEYTLEFESSGWSNADAQGQKVRVGKNENLTGVRIVAPEGGNFAIAGRVENGHGQPVAYADISLMTGWNYVDAQSESAGRFASRDSKKPSTKSMCPTSRIRTCQPSRSTRVRRI